MSADQVSEISPAIREAQSGGPDTCATLSMGGAAGCWVQFVDGVVNAAYPLNDEPSALVARMGNAQLEGWEAGQYLTVKLTIEDARSIARWIDQYFEQVLGAPEDYGLDVSIDQI